MKSVIVASTLAAGASAQFPFFFGSTLGSSSDNPFARNPFEQQQQGGGSGFSIQGSANGIRFSSSGGGLGGLINGLASLIGGAIGGGDTISNIPGCIDDATGDVKANGGSCSLLKNMFGCKKDLSTLSNKAKPGQLVEDVCPATCNTCDKVPTTSKVTTTSIPVAPRYSAPVAPRYNAPVYSTPSAPTLSSSGCVDDATGDVAARGASCPMLKGMFACSQDLSSFDARASPGTTLSVICPVTCNACPAVAPSYFAPPAFAPSYDTFAPSYGAFAPSYGAFAPSYDAYDWTIPSSAYASPPMQWPRQPEPTQYYSQPMGEQPESTIYTMSKPAFQPSAPAPAPAIFSPPAAQYYSQPVAAQHYNPPVPATAPAPAPAPAPVPAPAPATTTTTTTAPATATATAPATAPAASVCIDDATGDVKANGASCSLLKGLFGCKKDLSTLSNQASKGQLVESVCPKTCGKC